MSIQITAGAASAPAASETVAGVVELATTTEAATGTDTVRAVTPEGLALRKIGDGWALGSGGNSRGDGAVDLQVARSAPTQVASGYRSTVGGGQGNTASGANSAILGGTTNDTNALADAMIVGSNITASLANALHCNRLVITQIPVASAGLPSGAIWSDDGKLKVVP